MAKAIDPICQMEVDTDDPPGGRSEYEGVSYYFCAPGCQQAFDQNPGKYLSAQPLEFTPKGSFLSRLFRRP